ncbi:MAG TPA: PD-(D/E)XK nuclease domain-containing protein [Candidatus Enterocloster faecavium]|uniref:PD-(D/E)XK nuclease domain-containing protein n=1 Tax=Candidatus Enterocloster faecavium TaxID=2838560 RepID=A0A9D2L6D8_9FIRM|nr:PD-(D/E)XK nuclease domain-containing protein [Candidatus Enterocloster faecavium]
MEIKYAQDKELGPVCEKALRQIDDKGYAAELREEGFHTIYKYGIACFRKRCRVAVEKEEL